MIVKLRKTQQASEQKTNERKVRVLDKDVKEILCKQLQLLAGESSKNQMLRDGQQLYFMTLAMIQIAEFLEKNQSKSK